MTYPEIIKEIKAGKFRPFYLLMGDETYFIDQVVKAIEEKALPEDQRSFNMSVLYGRETDVNSIIAEAKRYPMMAERVVVIVKEAQGLKKLEDLEKYLNNPLESTVLVLAYKYKKVDKRTKFYKLINNRFAILESKKLYDNQIPEWIGKNLQQRGYNSSIKARQLLAESLGTDLGRIDNELKKLELVAKKGETIDEVMVEENIGISKDFNNFELVNALGKGKFAEAIKIQQYFAADPKDHPMVVTIGVLYSFFSKLMILHQAKDKSPKGLAALLKLNPYFVKDYQEAAHHYDLKKLARIIGYLREADVKSKGVGNTSTPDSELLRELIYKIIYV